MHGQGISWIMIDEVAFVYSLSDGMNWVAGLSECIHVLGDLAIDSDTDTLDDVSMNGMLLSELDHYDFIYLPNMCPEI